MTLKYTSTLACLCALPGLLIAQTIWYVRSDALPAGNDGLSWNFAFGKLQQALDKAQYGDEVWVSAGIYKTTDDGDRYKTFRLPSGVKVYGGFTGVETERQQRNWTLHPTILSGDLGESGKTYDNAYGILYATKTDSSTRLDGLVFEYGNANNPDDVYVFSHERTQSGAAIYLDAQGPDNYAYLTLANCTVRNNLSDYFGAVYANGRDYGRCALILDNCSFQRNRSKNYGGALVVENYYAQDQDVVIRNCTFRENFATIHGGALHLEHHRNVRVESTTFYRDSILFGIGGTVAIRGNNLKDTYTFDRCIFEENYGDQAGGFFVFTFYCDLRLLFHNCRFERNKSGVDQGSCMVLDDNLGITYLRYTQCVFKENVGILNIDAPAAEKNQVMYANCIFDKNLNTDFFATGNETASVRASNCIWSKPANAFIAGNGNLGLDHCIISRPDCSSLGAGISCGDGMLFNVNPMFVDAIAGNYHLKACSPAINAGWNPIPDTLGILTDPDGAARIANGKVDIGLYEHAIHFEPAITPVSCAGAGDGAIAISGFYCPPLAIGWKKGDQSGTQTNSLQGGNYRFTFTDARGIADTANLVIPEPLPLVVDASGKAVSCNGLADGQANVSAAGGTAPYTFLWENGSTDTVLTQLQAGVYPLSVSDALGCETLDTVTIGQPAPLAVFCSVIPATGPNNADGAIVIDSIAGGTPPYPWGAPGDVLLDLIQLLPGVYEVTLTDAAGCTVYYSYHVDFVIGTGQADDDPVKFWLSPNPASGAAGAMLRWQGTDVAAIELWDAPGRLVWRQPLARAGSPAEIPVPGSAGVYLIVLYTGAGRQVLRWAVY